MKTLAIIIGISEYEETMFPALPGARTDVAWLKRYLISLGLSSENIYTLIDENATKRNITKAIRQWPLDQTSEDIRLLVFFSGHGAIVKEIGLPAESVLMAYDTQYADRIGTGVTLAELVRYIRRLAVQELYIFLDACFMSIDSIARSIGEIPGLGLFKRITGSNCYLSMVANNEQKALETIDGGLGFFTKTLLSTLEELGKKKEPTISELVVTIQAIYKAQNLGHPYAILAGSTNTWPFGKLREKEETTQKVNLELDSLHIPRPEVVKSLSRKLRECAPFPLFLVGSAGNGKSTLLSELTNQLQDAVYIRSQDYRTVDDLIKGVIAEISTILPDVSLSLAEIVDTEASTKLIAANIPQLIIALDGVDELHENIIQGTIDFFLKYQIQICGAARNETKIPDDIIKYLCPNLSESESEKLLKRLGLTDPLIIKRLYQYTQGHPLKLRKYASDESTKIDIDSVSVQSETIQKVLTTNAFIDVDTFCRFMDIEISELRELERSGLIYKFGELWFPHKKLSDQSSFHSIQPATQKAAIKYWCHEARVRLRLVYPSKKIVEMVEDSALNLEEHDKCIATALEKVRQSGEPIQLENIYEALILKEKPLEGTLSVLADIFSEIGRFSAVDDIYNYISAKDINIIKEDRLRLTYARSCWWKGDYDQCMIISRQVIENSDNKAAVARAYLEEGIGYFFLGEWEKAHKSLITAEISEYASARTYGWSKLISGTIDCIRGTDFEEGKRRLETSIIILEEEGDLTGVAIAHGNLGESLWKKGEFEEAEQHLIRGYKFASIAGMNINAVENKRNQLQMEIRWHGPYSDKAYTLLKELSALTLEDIGSMEMMQVSNTVATAFLYRNEVEQSKPFIDLAEKLTKGNVEYYIYTLGNQCLVDILDKIKDDTKDTVDELIELAIDGDNFFALKQIYDDIKYVSHRYSRKHGRQIAASIENILTENFDNET